MLVSIIAVLAAVVWAAVATPTKAPLEHRSSPLDIITDLHSRQTGNLPSKFSWSSSDALVWPKDDGRNIAGIKDPSIVFYNGAYHVFVSTAQASGYNLVYFTFTDFAKANSSTFHYLDQTPIGTGYRAAPEVFYFAPQKLWYLVYQNGNAAYSTNPDIANSAGWSAPINFYPAGVPATVSNNIGSGYWTSLANFPEDMSEPVIALQDTANKYALYEASNVYNVGGGTFLLLVEAIGSDGARYFRSWTSKSLAGSWTPLADTEANPFARSNNILFASGKAWTKSISHGEVVRTAVDQTLTISPCGMRYLYQGLDPAAGGEYNALPWRLGLITQTNSTC
ncbi:glycoside hydrolase family 62 protein [Diaporthe eres]|nr:glycoside hydrolase family 62 protein [Diaporthe eres]